MQLLDKLYIFFTNYTFRVSQIHCNFFYRYSLLKWTPFILGPQCLLEFVNNDDNKNTTMDGNFSHMSHVSTFKLLYII